MGKSLTKTDKNIIEFVLIFTSIIFLSCITYDFKATIKGLSMVLAGLYFFFVMCHLMLCFPTIAIGMYLSSFLNYDIGLESLKYESEILFYSIHFVCTIIALFIVYIIVPILIAMMFNGNTDIRQAQELIGKI